MNDTIRRHARVRLRTVLAAVAAIAIACPWAVPWVKRTYFGATWNRWIVWTEVRPDGAKVRVRLRRLPDRDVVHEEILVPAPKTAADSSPRPGDKPEG